MKKVAVLLSITALAVLASCGAKVEKTTPTTTNTSTTVETSTSTTSTSTTSTEAMDTNSGMIISTGSSL